MPNKQSSMNNYYTYAYLREDGTPYYIGKGRGYRYIKPHSVSIPPKERILFLKRNLTEQEAFNHEIYMIGVFGRKDLGTGILHNRTNGGDGCSGCSPWNKGVKMGSFLTEDGRKRISNSVRDRCSKRWKLYYENGKVENVHNLEKWCRERNYDPNNLRKVGKIQARGYIYRSYRGIIKVEDVENPNEYNPWKWIVKFDDGKCIKIFSLSKWCIENDYNSGAMVAMSKGKLSKYKNVIKVDRHYC